MGFFTQHRQTLLLAAAVGAVFTSGASAQGAQTSADTAYVPFIVNVNATVKAELKEGAEVLSLVEKSVTANEEAVLRLPLPKGTGVLNGAPKRPTASATIKNTGGKITLNLPAHSYKNAEITLYSVSGKRVLRASALSATNGVSRPNTANGVYLLSVKGADNAALTSRVTHGGGALDIKVSFGDGSENTAATPRLAKSAAAVYWTITIMAADAGYVGRSYPFSPVAGTNPQQIITLEKTPAGTYAVVVLSDGTGASGSGSYAPGVTVNINAGAAPDGYRFINWATITSSVFFADANNVTTTFTMPATAATVTANFEAIPTNTVIVSSAGTDPAGGGTYRAGTTVSITAGTPPVDQRFKNWTTENSNVTFANADNAATTFTMPESAVTVTANFEPNTFRVTVISAGTGAAGSGEYAPGAVVDVAAGTAPTGFVFKDWGSNSNVVFANANNATTMFIMPSTAVTVQANYSGFGTFTDSRDSKTYKTIIIDGEMWMAKNLDYAPSSGSRCYRYSPDSCDKYGRLYDWETAKTSCPSGWHLPSRQEWGDLAKAAGGTGNYGAGGTAGTKLKSTSGWDARNGTDDYGFSALPGGYGLSDIYGSSYNTGRSGHWWTATEDGSSNAYYRDMYCCSVPDKVDEVSDDKRTWQSVRCLRD